MTYHQALLMTQYQRSCQLQLVQILVFDSSSLDIGKHAKATTSKPSYKPVDLQNDLYHIVFLVLVQRYSKFRR